MPRTSHRLLAGSAATLAALALAAAPALAGENDDGDDDDGDDAAQVQAPAPAPAAGSAPRSGSVSGVVPQGGVATGAGGTAPDGPGALLLGLASGALVLVAGGGRLIAVARRDAP